jgi:cobalt/nickel transport system permease protein
MLRKLVEETTRAVAAFERVRKTHVLYPYLFSAATVVAAFSPSLATAPLFITIGALAAWRGQGLREWLIVVGISTFFTCFVSLPAALGLLPAKTDLALFIARTTSSAAVLTGGLLYCGWGGFLAAFRCVLPQPIYKMLELFPPSVYALGRDAIVVTAAKEARTPHFDKWAFAAAVGDILIYGIERGKALRMAYEARSP